MIETSDMERGRVVSIEFRGETGMLYFSCKVEMPRGLPQALAPTRRALCTRWRTFMRCVKAL